jgi:cytochrome c oxidase accessory protein FixG
MEEDINYHSKVELEGKRKWLYPLVRKDKFYRYRNILSYLLLAALFVSPYIKVNGNQFMLFNFIERKFVLFGQVFWPQDFFILVLATLLFVISIVLFTIAFGRIFCGWICPQTIFLEMVFRKVEIWIEGEPAARKKLDLAPWDSSKIVKKVSKHAIFLLISFFIANTFLAYLIGSDALINIITEPISQHAAGFAGIWLFTLVFYWIFSQVRELVCTVVCPYGRLQGVMLDKNSLVVAYNYLRGEPRGKMKKTGSIAGQKGDCIDCNLCVAVCPTGIDIRQGTQLECVNCTACIDACNIVMRKIDRAENLIGYYSEEMIANNKKPSFTLRMKLYSLVIVLMFGVLSYFILSRKNIDVTILRASGTLYQEQENKQISNLYTVELINKTSEKAAVEIKAEDPSFKLKWIQEVQQLKGGESLKATFFLLLPAHAVSQRKTEVKLQVLHNGKLINTIKTNFLGPVN